MDGRDRLGKNRSFNGVGMEVMKGERGAGHRKSRSPHETQDRKLLLTSVFFTPEMAHHSTWRPTTLTQCGPDAVTTAWTNDYDVPSEAQNLIRLIEPDKSSVISAYVYYKVPNPTAKSAPTCAIIRAGEENLFDTTIASRDGRR
ncbi:hypothetical protein EVAR_46200_1 [Eumeta japonica]|uniref:Uncharacterized protein n=1 Tax=Eumeta variegata TaxID=151549 RepID=A0A4C1WFA4_EUMVA|nr:hypothetical protein EVAR_46200_1 [Eumeta japonica]